MALAANLNISFLKLPPTDTCKVPEMHSTHNRHSCRMQYKNASSRIRMNSDRACTAWQELVNVLIHMQTANCLSNLT